MTSYPKPKHVTNNFNSADFYDKNSGNSTILGQVLEVPATNTGVAVYKDSKKKLTTSQDLTFDASTNLSITPYSDNSTKITLYDNGDNTNGTCIAVGTNGELNTTIKSNAVDMAFWAGGKNTNGVELMRLKGSGVLQLYNTLQSNGKIQLKLPNTFPFLTTTGAYTSCSRSSAYPISIYASNMAATETRCGIAFTDTTATDAQPSADIVYTRIGGTPETGIITFNMSQNDSTRQQVMGIQWNEITMSKPLSVSNKFLTSSAVYNALTTTGTLSSCTLAKNYPVCIYSTTGNNTAARSSIAFVDNSNTNTQAAVDITYFRTDAINDIGKLDFNLSTSATTRENILSLQSTQVVANKAVLCQNKITSVLPSSFSAVVSTGTLSSCTQAKNYPLCIYASNGSTTAQRAAIAFVDSTGTTNQAAADIVYNRTNATNDIGELDFNLTTSATTRETIFTIQPAQNISLKPMLCQDKITSVLPSTFTAVVSTGALTSCTQAKNYPLCIYASTGSTTAQRAAIAFVDSTGTTNQAAADIVYKRTDATVDLGELQFNLTTDAVTRENIMTVKSNEVNISKNLYVGLNQSIWYNLGVNWYYQSWKNLFVNGNACIYTRYQQPLTNLGTTTLSGGDQYPLQLQYPNNYTGTYLGISFQNNEFYDSTPGCTIDYTRTDATYDIGQLDFNLTTSSGPTTRENILSIQPTQVSAAKPFNVVLPSTFSNILATGQVSGSPPFLTPAKSYPICIYAQTGTLNQRRAAIAFADNPTNSNDIPACDISYMRQHTPFDTGRLEFNMLTGWTSSTAYTRTSLAIFNSSIMFFNRPITIGNSVNGSVSSLPGVNQCKLNVNTNVLEPKICLYDAQTNGTMAGMGVSTNQFNFQLPSSSYSYTWRYGATNDTGTEMMRLNWVAALSNLTTTAGPALGIGKTPTYQLELNTNSAGKPVSTAWVVTSDERIKENIELANLDICYNNIKALPLKRFRWKDDVYSDAQINDRNVTGWIAQDIEKVFKKSVTKSQNFGFEDCRSVDIDEIQKQLYGAVQKLMQKVEMLEQTNEILLTKVSSLESELKNLKNNI